MQAIARREVAGKRLEGRSAMSDPATRAMRYRERAAECLRLAEIAAADDIKEHYRRLADHYDELAAAEDRQARDVRLDWGLGESSGSALAE
jgi:branched-subunit amino acid aminotransferase/4-amino-4-deoxychorismate lyase